MKNLLLSSLMLCLVPIANAQSLSDGICENHKNIMEQTILSWRENQMPVGRAENVFNFEKDVRTRVFLKEVVREIYKNPQAGQQYLRSGKFKSDCVKTHRGY